MFFSPLPYVFVPQNKNAMNDLTTLKGRLGFCADKAGGKRPLAALSGVSEAQLFRYISGDSEIPAARVVSVAQAAKVDAGWLLTGHGAPSGVTPEGLQPPFRADLMRQLSQVLDEVLVEYPTKISPRQKSRYLAFMYETVRQEEVRSDKHWEPSRGLMVNYLDFLCGLKDEEGLDLYERFARLVTHQQSIDLAVNEQASLAQAITQAYLHYFNGLSGEAIYRRFTQQVNAGTAEQLFKMATLAVSLYGTQRPLRLLDLGCGNGRGLLFLHQNFPSLELHGLEMSTRGVKLTQSLEKARQLVPGTVQQGDMQLIPHPDASFDVLYSRQSIYTLPLLGSSANGLRRFLAESSRVLRPGGMMVLSTFTAPQDTRLLMPFVQLLSAETLKIIADEAGFDVADSSVADLSQFIQKAGFKQSIPSGFECELSAILYRRPPK